MKKTLVATNPQKMLDFLIQNPGKEYLSREIQKATGISKAGTNFALRDLVRTGLIEKTKRGKLFLYLVDFRHPVIRQLKVLRVILWLVPSIKKLQKESNKIILYGSSSRGEDVKDSDIDLLVVTNNPQGVERIVRNTSNSKTIQLIVRSPLKYVEMEKTEPVFHKEIEQGIVLWESTDES